MSEEKSKPIFDISHKDQKYKGVLFAELDNIETYVVPMPDDYVAGLMAIIYVDAEGVWRLKARIKFPSGNKQVWERSYQGIVDINETFILHDLYRLPLKNKHWHRNETEDQEGILKILEENNMIESIRIIEVGEENG